MRFSELSGRRVAIWGHGREGRSAEARCRALGLHVAVAEPDLETGPETGLETGVTYGAAGRELLLGADVVIKSPGVPAVSPLYRELLERGVALTSVADLFVSEHADRTVAVTGTKGKSTTAALVHHLLTHLGHRSSLRGNIGTSVLEESDPPAETVVMELSSYQAQSLTRSPRVVVVTSLFPEHLTWHGSEEAYYRDKLNAVAHGPEVVVVPGNAPDVERRVRAQLSPGARLVRTDETTVRVDKRGDLMWADGTVLEAARLPIPGRHQAGNVALALVVVQLLGFGREEALAGLASFAPLPHRMEVVPSTDGRTWIDDSLATAPQAVVATLESLPEQDVAVVIGGADRGLDHAVLVEHLRTHPRVRPLLVGPAGARIGRAVQAPVFRRFRDALDWARSEANPARVVLLCPGAPSYDEFTDFEARSAAFRAAAAGG